MPRYNDRDKENPDDISWFKDNLYNDGDNKNPDNFSCFKDTPAFAADNEGYYNHPNSPDHPNFPIMKPDNNAPPPPAKNYRGGSWGDPSQERPTSRRGFTCRLLSFSPQQFT